MRDGSAGPTTATPQQGRVGRRPGGGLAPFPLMSCALSSYDKCGRLSYGTERSTDSTARTDHRGAPTTASLGYPTQVLAGVGFAVPNRLGLCRGLVQQGSRRARGCVADDGRQVALALCRI